MVLSSSVVFLLSLLLLPTTPTSSQCIGMPCQYKGECRSKLGECGTTTAHCDAESQWVAACGGGSELVRPAVVIDTTANNDNNNINQQSPTTFHPMDTNRDGYIEQAEIDAASTNTIPQQQQQQQQQTQNMQTTSSGAMDASQQVVVTTTTTATATIPPSAMTQTSLGQEGAVSVEDNAAAAAAAAAAAEQAKIKEAIDQELNEASELLSPTSIESGQQQTQLQQQQQQTPTISPITLWEEWSNQQSGGSTGSTSNTDSSSSSSSSSGTIYQHPNTNETEGWGDLNAWDNGRTKKEDGGVFDMMEDYVFGEDDTSSSSSSSLSTFGSGTMMSIEGRIMTTLVLFKSMLLLLGY